MVTKFAIYFFVINDTNGRHTLVSYEIEMRNIPTHSFLMFLLVILEWISITFLTLLCSRIISIS